MKSSDLTGSTLTIENVETFIQFLSLLSVDKENPLPRLLDIDNIIKKYLNYLRYQINEPENKGEWTPAQNRNLLAYFNQLTDFYKEDAEKLQLLHSIKNDIQNNGKPLQALNIPGEEDNFTDRMHDVYNQTIQQASQSEPPQSLPTNTRSGISISEKKNVADGKDRYAFNVPTNTIPKEKIVANGNDINAFKSHVNIKILIQHAIKKHRDKIRDLLNSSLAPNERQAPLEKLFDALWQAIDALEIEYAKTKDYESSAILYREAIEEIINIPKENQSQYLQDNVIYLTKLLAVSRFHCARKYYNEKKYEESIDQYTQISQLMKATPINKMKNSDFKILYDSLSGLATAYNMLGHRYFENEAYAQSIKLYQLAIESFRAIPLSYDTTAITRRISRCYTHLAHALGHLGMANYRSNQYEKAIENFRASVVAFNKIPEEYMQSDALMRGRMNLAKSYNTLGEKYTKNQNHEMASTNYLTAISEALALPLKYQDKEYLNELKLFQTNLENSYFSIAMNFQNKGNHEESKKAINACKIAGEDRMKTEARLGEISLKPKHGYNELKNLIESKESNLHSINELKENKQTKKNADKKKMIKQFLLGKKKPTAPEIQQDEPNSNKRGPMSPRSKT